MNPSRPPLTSVSVAIADVPDGRTSAIVDAGEMIGMFHNLLRLASQGGIFEEEEEPKTLKQMGNRAAI